jgi:hypothetical protein
MPGGFKQAASSPPCSSVLGMASQRSSDGDDQGQPEALATEGDWSAYLDGQVTGLVYYFNARCVRFAARADAHAALSLLRCDAVL